MGDHDGRRLAEVDAVFSCGIDPGRDKFGIAVADGDHGEKLFFSAIAPTSELDIAVGCLFSGDFKALAVWRTENGIENCVFHVNCLYIGQGTGFAFFSRKLDEKDVNYNIIDESYTTLEGRSLYWKLHPPRGLWKLIPLPLRIPPRPVDDLAAWVILKRGIKKRSEIQNSR
jgi:hypothetical protein